tara:strand:+ start:86423 stop:87589 length:1167 start_codon:yes stop_codon:yes gene_type:complete
VTLQIKNTDARRLWLSTNGLTGAPTGALDLPQIIKSLGFVQLDTIQVVARAHHHILWSRNQNYREPMFDALYTDRHIFEHFTHDASIIPMEFLPMWKRQFERKSEQIERSKWFNGRLGAAGCTEIIDKIRDQGALSTHAFNSAQKGPREMWDRPAHKQTLDYLWYVGRLATCYRENFVKYYNLPERVFPASLHDQSHPDESQIDWLCNAALSRLGVASLKEIQQFWEAMTITEVKLWAERTELQSIQIQGSDRTYSDAFALPDIEPRLHSIPNANTRIRIINPFDPATRDRIRLKRLFGFDYKIEMFVPAAKRKWGYYVYPILQGNKFIGRIEVKAVRAKSALTVHNLWTENGVKWSASQAQKLDAELDRLARFVGVKTINWDCSKQP